MPTPNLKKRFATQEADDVRLAKKPWPEPEPPDDLTVAKMARKCEFAINNFRWKFWTDYARIHHRLVKHNFGLGLEEAVQCLGCRRLLPPSLITGDHIAPKSDMDKLRKAIAFDIDMLDKYDYHSCLLERPVKVAVYNLKRSSDLRMIIHYDQGLPHDVRNIQPLCWACNTRKGNRENVQLYPQHALLPRRPNEAPF